MTTVPTGYDPTLYHEHPQTARLYAKNSGFVVEEENDEVSAFREDMPGSLFILTQATDKRWCWVRTA